MESQPQIPEFRKNPENFHRCQSRKVTTTGLFTKLNLDNSTWISQLGVTWANRMGRKSQLAI